MAEEFHDEWISAYLDGELSGEEKARFEDEVEKDPARRRLLDELRSLRATLKSLPEQHPSRDLTESILSEALRQKGAAEPQTQKTAVESAPIRAPQRTAPGETSGRGRLLAVIVPIAVAASLLFVFSFPWLPDRGDRDVTVQGDAQHRSEAESTDDELADSRTETVSGDAVEEERGKRSPASRTEDGGEADLESEELAGRQLADRSSPSRGPEFEQPPRERGEAQVEMRRTDPRSRGAIAADSTPEDRASAGGGGGGFGGGGGGAAGAEEEATRRYRTDEPARGGIAEAERALPARPSDTEHFSRAQELAEEQLLALGTELQDQDAVDFLSRELEVSGQVTLQFYSLLQIEQPGATSIGRATEQEPGPDPAPTAPQPSADYGADQPAGSVVENWSFGFPSETMSVPAGNTVGSVPGFPVLVVRSSLPQLQLTLQDLSRYSVRLADMSAVPSSEAASYAFQPPRGGAGGAMTRRGRAFDREATPFGGGGEAGDDADPAGDTGDARQALGQSLQRRVEPPADSDAPQLGVPPQIHFRWLRPVPLVEGSPPSFDMAIVPFTADRSREDGGEDGGDDGGWAGAMGGLGPGGGAPGSGERRLYLAPDGNFYDDGDGSAWFLKQSQPRSVAAVILLVVEPPEPDDE